MKPSWLTGIGALTLFVPDKAEAKAFYLSAFELPVHYEDEVSVVFRIGETLVNLLAQSEADELIAPASVADSDSGTRSVFTVDVASVDDVCADLTRRGVELLNGPIDRPWGVRTACFVGPGGHIWEVAQPIRG